MTESVTPPDPPLVDPETGETPPLSPQRWLDERVKRVRREGGGVVTLPPILDLRASSPEQRRAWLYGEWDELEADLAAHLESDSAA